MSLDLSIAYRKQTLEKLISKGVAVYREVDTCHFIAHRENPVQPVLDTIPGEQLQNLLAMLPQESLIAPVSQEQERHLYHSEVMHQWGWNVQHIHELTLSNPDLSILHNAMDLVVQNHDLLRTYYLALVNGWAQVITAEAKLEIQPIEFSELSNFMEFVALERNRLLPIDSFPLCKIWICQIDTTWYLGFVSHHSLADAFTSTMLLAELMECYHTLVHGKKENPEPVIEQYWQYALCRFDKEGYGGEETLAYWQNLLGHSNAALAIKLPYVADPPSIDDERFHIAGSEIIPLPDSLNHAIASFSRKFEISCNQLFTTAIALLLVHGMGNRRIIPQFVTSQRDRLSLANTLGEFTNMLFLPFDLEEMGLEDDIMDLLTGVKKKSLKSLRYGKVDFAEILSMTGLENYAGYFQQTSDVIINSADIDTGTKIRAASHGSSLSVQSLSGHSSSSNKEQAVATLFYQILTVNKHVHLITSFRKSLFTSKDIRLTSSIIVQLVEKIIAQPHATVRDIVAGVESDMMRLENRPQHYRKKAGNRICKPLSEGQKGLWMLQKMDPEMTAYNVPIALKIHDKLEADTLREALQCMIRKHPILQTVFTVDAKGVPQQYQDLDRPLSFQQVAMPPSDQDLKALLITTFKQPFRLDRDPLMRVHIFSRSETEHILLITIHHIIFDGTSITVFIQDLLSIYEHCSNDNCFFPSSGGNASYDDFVTWEKGFLASEKGQRHRAFWQEQLAGDLPLLNLPTDKPRPARQTFNGATCQVTLSADISGRLRSLARKLEVSLFVLMLAFYQLLLSRYCRQNDIIVGLPTMGRPEKQFHQLLGYFVNMLPLRTLVSGKESFVKFVTRLQRNVALALDHGQYPFSKLVSELQDKTEPSMAPVFQTIFVLQNLPSMADRKLFAEKQLQVSAISGLHQEGDFDLSMELVAGDIEITVNLSYNPDLFHEQTIRNCIAHYQQLAEEVLKEPHQALQHCNMLPEGERKKILKEWNSRQADGFSGKLVHEVFVNQARKTPQAMALFCGKQSLTYRELNSDSLQLAKKMQQQGVEPGQLVALCMERSLDMVIGVLAIFRAGGVLLPIDHRFPAERIKEILKDSLAAILLTSEGLEERMAELVDGKDCVLQVIGRDWKRGGKVKGRLKKEVCGDDPAYVIYTSGSTGKPKGVVVSHGSICSHCIAVSKVYELTADDRILQFAPLHVDTALEQILPGLMIGASLFLKDDSIWPVAVFREKTAVHGITVVDLPPAYLHELLLNGGISLADRLRLVICGGESLSTETVAMWQGNGNNSVRLINAYGPTETTITSTIFEVTEDFRPDIEVGIPIGRPLPGESVYVLDQQGQLCPTGVVGELHISGTGVASGYLNRPELTREKFVKDPFNPDRRMYKTGDLARWRHDGNVEYRGRIDYQVKIRGFRVECGEIESLLLEQDGVRNGVVVPLEIHDDHDTRLVAFFVPTDPNRPVEVRQLLKVFTQSMPDYMVPAMFVPLSALPLTASGKIDRIALAKHDIEPADKTQLYAVPETAIESKLVEIWKKILNVSQVGIRDNFFDLGGHSILAIRLMAAIQHKFGRELPMATLFQAPVIQELAKKIEQESNNHSGIRTPLVVLKQEGAKTPFFCVHPVGGTVMAYHELASQFGSDYPFYGLQSPELVGMEHPGSVEGLAALYIREIQKIQPVGPYQLGGWSMGGIVAWEMTYQLQRSGHESALLTLIESYTPLAVKMVEESYMQDNNRAVYDEETLLTVVFVRELGLYNKEISEFLLKSSADSKGLLDEVFIRAKKMELLPETLDREQIENLFRIFCANSRAMDSYKPKPLNGKIILFSAIDESWGGNDRESSNGWQELCGSELKIVRVPGTHYTLLNRPNVDVIQGERLKLMESNRERM